MYDLPASIKHFFPTSTDFSRLVALSASDSAAKTAAQTVIASLGGLKVGATGPGLEQAASDIEFRQDMEPGSKTVARAWRKKLGELVSVAYAHHAYIELFVDSRASFYAFTDPDGKLYALGRFDQAMEKLLLGLNFGTPLEPDR